MNRYISYPTMLSCADAMQGTAAAIDYPVVAPDKIDDDPFFSSYMIMICMYKEYHDIYIYR